MFPMQSDERKIASETAEGIKCFSDSLEVTLCTLIAERKRSLTYWILPQLSDKVVQSARFLSENLCISA